MLRPFYLQWDSRRGGLETRPSSQDSRFCQHDTIRTDLPLNNSSFVSITGKTGQVRNLPLSTTDIIPR